MASSLARPPALRITWASPSAKPAYLAGSSRASMQVRMAKRRDGGRASLSLSPKLAAYARLDANTSERTWLIWNPPVDQLGQRLTSRDVAFRLDFQTIYHLVDRCRK